MGDLPLPYAILYDHENQLRYFLSRFRFKYYPENVADEIIQDNTLRLLFLQVIAVLPASNSSKNVLLLFFGR
jgi:hypothetical protein